MYIYIYTNNYKYTYISQNGLWVKLANQMQLPLKGMVFRSPFVVPRVAEMCEMGFTLTNIPIPHCIPLDRLLIPPHIFGMVSFLYHPRMITHNSQHLLVTHAAPWLLLQRFLDTNSSSAASQPPEIIYIQSSWCRQNVNIRKQLTKIIISLNQDILSTSRGLLCLAIILFDHCIIRIVNALEHTRIIIYTCIYRFNIVIAIIGHLSLSLSIYIYIYISIGMMVGRGNYPQIADIFRSVNCDIYPEIYLLQM